ncbi:MAG TPA: biotin--[acetyl-CoA-carboxylase] ligase, partial [Vicinamibacteria bacterium]|nr:biotin--[acetyl-CoA-carboxylase] ligase [Vicinamibacteria bacterium]
MSGGPRSRLSERLRTEKRWPGEIYHFAELGSTNDWLKDACRHGLPEWSLVVADRQTAGRGRHGRAWASPPGNLYLSVLLRPRLPAELVSLLPLLAGVAVVEAAAGWGVAAELKWPNDVQAGGLK